MKGLDLSGLRLRHKVANILDRSGAGEFVQLVCWVPTSGREGNPMQQSPCPTLQGRCGQLCSQMPQAHLATQPKPRDPPDLCLFLTLYIPSILCPTDPTFKCPLFSPLHHHHPRANQLDFPWSSFSWSSPSSWDPLHSCPSHLSPCSNGNFNQRPELVKPEASYWRECEERAAASALTPSPWLWVMKGNCPSCPVWCLCLACY